VSPRPRSKLTIVLPLLALLACRREPAPSSSPSAVSPPPAAASAPDPKLVDRLAPGELEPGKSQVFGFDVPRDMSVQGVFLEVAYIQGKVTPEALANYVRDRVEVDRVEIGASSTLFSRAHIKRGSPERLYDFTVSPGAGSLTELVIRDVTPRPKNPAGMTDADRWRQAGRKPDGTPVDPAELR
jgi:hypothetical protein